MVKPAASGTRSRTALTALAFIGLCSLGCAGRARDRTSDSAGGSSGSGQSGEGSAVAGVGASAGGEAGIGAGTPGPKALKLRLLTRTEYKNSLADLLGPIRAPLTLPEDTSVAGFVSVGAAMVSLASSSVKQYEAATNAATAEVFGDDARYRKLVGCEPKADLSDACVTTFIRSFGKRAFRRDLTDDEVAQWLQVAQAGAALAGSAAQGLGNAVYGMLQSPNFLYRAESSQLDSTSGRYKYDAASTAARLSYLLTGSTPNDALLAAAAAGRLDTAEGVKTAAATLLSDSRALDRMAEFFGEVSQADLIQVVPKDPNLFPSFSDALRGSMLQATQLFIKNVVLAPGADARSFFDSDQTFVDATLAPIYGVAPPPSGFQQIKLGPETARAGILGQAAVIAGHSAADRTSPTRRGVFILRALLCQVPPDPPAGVVTSLPAVADPTLTVKQRLAEHNANPACSSCHEMFDPLGLALEHFDSIGRYRAVDGQAPIDATGSLEGVSFDGEVEFSRVLRENSNAQNCMVSNFYRNANALASADADAAQVNALIELLASKGYVWRDLVAEFVATDAFRSAPAAAITAGK